MKNKLLSRSLLLVLVLLVAGGALRAQIPNNMAYQRYLTKNGVPHTGTARLDIFMWDAQTGGNQIWSESFSNPPVQVTQGYYSVMLDFGPNSGHWTNGVQSFNKAYWLEVHIDDNVMQRIQLAVSPYAFNAHIADSATMAANAYHSTISDSAIRIPQAPVGTIVAYGGQAFGVQQEKSMGWYMCDGTLISATDFPDYKSQVGSIYGTNFSGDSVYLPDLRGLFLRGINGSRKDTLADPDASNRIALNGHGLAGNQIGSVQLDALQSHDHAALGRYGINGGNQATAWAFNTDGVGSATRSDGAWTAKSGGAETRPKNAYVYWLIKVR